jgi:putative SOS response-associated peptidase YedK
MCYHVEVPNWSELEKLETYSVRNDEWEEYYHHISGFTNHHLPVITSQNPKQIQPYAWGLIPAWAANKSKANEIRLNTLNAKSETAFELASFKNSK